MPLKDVEPACDIANLKLIPRLAINNKARTRPIGRIRDFEQDRIWDDELGTDLAMNVEMNVAVQGVIRVKTQAMREFPRRFARLP